MCMFQLKDLQDISNITRKNFNLKYQSFEVREAFTEIVNMYKMQAALKNIEVLVYIDEDIPNELICDKVRLQ